MIALSLGWGVQSFTMAAMSALGDLPKVDVAIHADTTHERQATYDFVARWTPWLEVRGIKVVTVRASEKRISVIDAYGGVMLPAYTMSTKGDAALYRQCTDNWKRTPIRRYLQSVRNGEHIEQWIGISTDEAMRMKESDVKYITHRWTLIEKGISRNDCVSWLKAHGLEVPVKSSCIF